MRRRPFLYVGGRLTDKVMKVVVEDLLRRFLGEQAYGKLTLTAQAGKLALITTERTFKPEELEGEA